MSPAHRDVLEGTAAAQVSVRTIIDTRAAVRLWDALRRERTSSKWRVFGSTPFALVHARNIFAFEFQPFAPVHLRNVFESEFFLCSDFVAISFGSKFAIRTQYILFSRRIFERDKKTNRLAERSLFPRM